MCETHPGNLKTIATTTSRIVSSLRFCDVTVAKWHSETGLRITDQQLAGRAVKAFVTFVVKLLAASVGENS